jgi:hypothetical protein
MDMFRAGCPMWISSARFPRITLAFSGMTGGRSPSSNLLQCADSSDALEIFSFFLLVFSHRHAQPFA